MKKNCYVFTREEDKNAVPVQFWRNNVFDTEIYVTLPGLTVTIDAIQDEGWKVFYV